jgi:hypothetical protein
MVSRQRIQRKSYGAGEFCTQHVRKHTQVVEKTAIILVEAGGVELTTGIENT